MLLGAFVVEFLLGHNCVRASSEWYLSLVQTDGMGWEAGFTLPVLIPMGVPLDGDSDLLKSISFIMNSEIRLKLVPKEVKRIDLAL